MLSGSFHNNVCINVKTILTRDEGSLFIEV